MTHAERSPVVEPIAGARHLYVHVPFCARRCSYCDFSIAVRKFTPVDDFLRGTERELDLRIPIGDHAPELDTLYLGGGTPSRLGAEGILRLLHRIARHASLASDAEVTIEANPDDVTERRAAAWSAAGVNRISLGSQSFDARVLEWMHRAHTAEDIPRAVQVARAAGIENLSLDLIFAAPVELERDWQRDVESAVALEPRHLSLYGLTVEPGTPLARWQSRGEAHEAPEERFEQEFLDAHNTLAAAGYEHYEVSNYARAGARSRHNLAYWSRVPYLGLGPSAHSFDGSARWWNEAAYAEWLMRLDAGGDPLEEREVLTEEQVEAERIYLGLRTTHGIAIPPGSESMVHRWRSEGWADITGGTVRLTPLGWLRLDALAAALTPVASRS
jgi:oxygen-independent coproporphyrinogen-3 oxidase